MMDTEKRVALVKSRAWQMRRRQNRHRIGRLSLLSALLCCCLIYAAGDLSGSTPGAVQGLNGATMLLQDAGGYVLVGVLCFVAAVVITVLCIRAREEGGKQEKQAKQDEEK